MIPTSTGAAQATALVLPEFAGKVDGMAIRVPVPDGSITDIVTQLERSTSVKEINARLREAAACPPLLRRTHACTPNRRATMTECGRNRRRCRSRL